MRVQVGCIKLWVKGKLCIWFEVKFRISQGGEKRRGEKVRKIEGGKRAEENFRLEKPGEGSKEEEREKRTRNVVLKE